MSPEVPEDSTMCPGLNFLEVESSLMSSSVLMKGFVVVVVVVVVVGGGGGGVDEICSCFSSVSIDVGDTS